MKEEIEQLFGGKDAEGQNALFHVIKNRGYRFFEITPKTSMTVKLFDDLDELGYCIRSKKP